ncbi:UDP-N-acetylmuramoyl-tripeptide--D-alanyl-D-alanine ligase [Roseobacter sp. N2S]|uniref:UDP-N-acetylmuramoyl-tripeptide--D-alanyl-D- alanine ligase n=1 Tax=Roseobacter sp. N2S TaxID=2663844 RepID=UPI002855DB2E|nr:UDP-N-acetylmuramoyl-tripeptide--D-alanyl-D-alanine ligase [Roseobacter sp. N2S]MDR6264132.1 UDP-N-acetylmuramoyl-tripeptide--D-alanyl-D-alanine ligase [Roseobacter sp. N2S]
MSVLWTSAAAAAATGGQNSCDWVASGVSIDTRELRAGDLFVALKDIRDGHDFVAQALASGAAAALVTHRPEGVAADAPLLIVPDVLAALEALGQAARARTQAKVIGITGSVGKTGTKEMLRTALAGQGAVHAAVRSFNNHWGVPLTLARMPQDTDFAVIEIGMNHPGEIGPLSQMARLDVAVITTVAAVHMAAFDDVDQIAKAKAEIFEGLGPKGVAVLNADIPTLPLLRRARKEGRTLLFGRAEQADIQLVASRTATTVTTVEARLNGQDILFKLGAAGDHLAMNALAVLGAVQAVGADVAQAMLALASWHAPSGRGQRFEVVLGETGEVIELIDESYNANPTSMAAALAVLAAAEPVDTIGRVSQGRRVAFLGDMLELGPQELALHADLSELPCVADIDLIHTSGPLMAALHAALPDRKRGQHFDDAQAMAARVNRLLDSGDVAMVKGSLGSKVGQVVTAIKSLGQTTEK